MVKGLDMERVVMMFNETMSAAAGHNRSFGTDDALLKWANAVRDGEVLTPDELKNYVYRYLRVVYPAHYPDAEPVSRTSIHLQRDIADDLQVIGEMIEKVNAEGGILRPTELRGSRTGKYNRQLILALALLRQADEKSKAA